MTTLPICGVLGMQMQSQRECSLDMSQFIRGWSDLHLDLEGNVPIITVSRVRIRRKQMLYRWAWYFVVAHRGKHVWCIVVYLCKCQLWFRKGHSTSSCLLGFLDGIFNDADMGAACEVLFLDLRKASDSAHHDIVLQKLRLAGVSENATRWFTSYLTGDSQVTNKRSMEWYRRRVLLNMAYHRGQS